MLCEFHILCNAWCRAVRPRNRREEKPLAWVGSNIACFRRALRLSQPELADRAGISIQSLCRIEIEGPYNTYMNTVYLVSEALGVPLDILFDKDIQKKEEK